MKSKAEIDQLAKSLKPVVEAAVTQCSDDALTVKDVAKMLNVSTWAIYTRCREHQIPFTKKHGRLYFSKNAITKYYLSN